MQLLLGKDVQVKVMGWNPFFMWHINALKKAMIKSD